MSQSADESIETPAQKAGNKLGWFAVALPWAVGLVLLTLACRRTYLDGWNFIKGLHGLMWIGFTFIGALVFLSVFLYACILVISRRKRFTKGTLKWAVLLLLSSLAVPVGAFPAMSRSFYSGRSAAYRSLDYEEIYATCKELAARVRQSGNNFVLLHPNDAELEQLPPAIRSLSPDSVHATANAVSIKMDGGGVMYHEGIGIIVPDDKSTAVAILEHCQRTLDNCHRLDDYHHHTNRCRHYHYGSEIHSGVDTLQSVFWLCICRAHVSR